MFLFSCPYYFTQLVYTRTSNTQNIPIGQDWRMFSDFLLRPISLINIRKKLIIKWIFNFFQICITYMRINHRRFWTAVTK